MVITLSVSDKAIEDGAGALGSALGKNSENMARVGLERLGERLGDRVNNGLWYLGAFIAAGITVGFALIGGSIIGHAIITSSAAPSIKYNAPPSPIESNRATSSPKKTKDDAPCTRPNMV